MSILRLPVETFREIFRIAISKPKKVFAFGSDFLDCFALVDISRVCRHWRSIALADPALWTSICFSLRDPSPAMLHEAASFTETFLGRSEQLPLTCSITLTNVDGLQLSHPLVRAVVRHELRWERIEISVVRSPSLQPSRVFWEDEGVHPSSPIPLSFVKPCNLKELRLNHALWYTGAAPSPFPSLTSLHLSDVRSALDVWAWLRQMPNLEELELNYDAIRAEHVLSKRWPLTMARLKTIDVPAFIYPSLTCSALENVVVKFHEWFVGHSTTYFVDFVRRSAVSLGSLDIEWNLSKAFSSARAVRGYLLPTIRLLSLIFPCMTSSHLIDLLAERANEDVVRVLPELERLELVNYNVRHAIRFVHFVSVRWNVRKRTLQSVKLTRSFCAGAAFPRFKVGDSPEMVAYEWRPVQICVNEGLIMDIA